MPDLPLPLATGLQERLVLLLNHVLGREPAALDRLRPLAGQSLRVKLLGQPAWAPQLPPLIAPGGAVIPFQNGVDAPDIVMRAVGPERMGGGIAYIAATIRAFPPQTPKPSSPNR